MADIFGLPLTLDLADEVAEEEPAGLRWRLGPGPRPDVLRSVTEFPFVAADAHGELVIEDHPEPFLSDHGEASKVGGALVSDLLTRQNAWCGVWAVASRLEIRPDGFECTGELLS
jgi:hypothetical protein